MKKLNRPLVVVVAAIVAGGCSTAWPAAAFKPDNTVAIRRMIDRDWRSAQVGVYFAKLGSDTPLFEHDAHKLMMPASNTKLFTSALALHVLGPQHRFRTELRMDGAIDKDGILNGNLYLVGGGDPSLMRKDLAGYVQAAQMAGIKRVTGALIADASLIPDGPFGFGWEIDDLPFSYQPEVRALSLDLNAVTLIVTAPMSEGEPARIVVDPPTDFIRVENKVRVTKEGARSVAFERIPHERTFNVVGTMPVGAEPARQRVSIPDPPLFAAHELRAQLTAAGITVDRIGTGLAASTTKLVGVVESAPLAELTRHLNKVSDNLYAELFLRAVGLKTKGSATAASGRAALTEWLTAQKIPTDEIRLSDGSGLSRHNLVSPRTTARLLQMMGAGPHRDLFVASLPVMGEDGTLASRMRNTAAHRVVRAKTGTLGGVSTVSGYLAVTGETYVFSIMINNNIRAAAQARRVQDDLLLNLMEGVRKGNSK